MGVPPAPNPSPVCTECMARPRSASGFLRLSLDQSAVMYPAPEHSLWPCWRSARPGPHKTLGLGRMAISVLRLSGRRSTVRPSRSFRSQMWWDPYASRMFRGPSLTESLNGDILAVSCEHRPSDPCKLVGQGYGDDVAVCSRKEGLNPPAERRIFLGQTRESRARPMDQQHPQVTVAALADVQQPRFSTCRRLARHQSQPSCQVTATAERLGISHRRDKGSRRQHADPRDPNQSLGSVLMAHPFGEFVVVPFDPLVDAPPLLTHVLNEPSKPWSETVALVRRYLRQMPLE